VRPGLQHRAERSDQQRSVPIEADMRGDQRPGRPVTVWHQAEQPGVETPVPGLVQGQFGEQREAPATRFCFGGEGHPHLLRSEFGR